MCLSSEGPWIDESVYSHLIEFSKNDYVEKTNMLPNNFYYNMFKIFYAPYKYVKFILKTSMGDESYEKIMEILKNC